MAKVSALFDGASSSTKFIPSPDSEPSEAPTAVILAEIHGHRFACLIDFGTDAAAISYTIVNFLSDNGNFLPTSLPSKSLNFKSVDGHEIDSQGEVKICPKMDTVARPIRLRNKKAFIMPCKETITIRRASFPGEIILGNPFLVYFGFNVTDFIAQNADRLSSLNFGVLNTDTVPKKVGKLGVKLLTSSALQEFEYTACFAEDTRAFVI